MGMILALTYTLAAIHVYTLTCKLINGMIVPMWATDEQAHKRNLRRIALITSAFWPLTLGLMAVTIKGKNKPHL